MVGGREEGEEGYYTAQNYVDTVAYTVGPIQNFGNARGLQGKNAAALLPLWRRKKKTRTMVSAITTQYLVMGEIKLLTS